MLQNIKHTYYLRFEIHRKYENESRFFKKKLMKKKPKNLKWSETHIKRFFVINNFVNFLLLPPEFFCQTSFWQNDLVLLNEIES